MGPLYIGLCPHLNSNQARMLESPYATISPLPEQLSSSASYDGHGASGPGAEAISEVALGVRLLHSPVEQLPSLHVTIPPQCGSSMPKPVDGHVPGVLHAPLPEYGVPEPHHAQWQSPVPDWSNAPCQDHSSSPVPQHQRYICEENDDHFVRRWQQW